MKIIRYPEMASKLEQLHPEIKETQKKVISDFQDEQGNHPEIKIDSEKGLILFDLDETIWHGQEIHGRAIQLLWKEKFNLEADTQVWFKNFGLGDYEEFRLFLEHYHLSYDDPLIQELCVSYADKMGEALEQLTAAEKEKLIIPEALAFLESAHKIKVPMGVVTGNVKKTTDAIVKYLGLAKYFICGGYGDDEGTAIDFPRPVILGHALNRCFQKVGDQRPPMSRILVIGDTPKDSLAAAHVDPELRQILVATGDYSLSTLRAVSDTKTDRKPDLVLKGMSQFYLYQESHIKQILGNNGYQEYLKYLRARAKKVKVGDK